MSTVVVALGVVVAVAAAIRSTWSPCGVSMLSTVTPMAERSRGHRFGVTAAWFVVGAIVGGATLGLLAAGLAEVVAHLGLSPQAALAVAATAALITATSDVSPFGWHLPTHRRQVDELWLGRYRRWVYASGFGWQIGSGVATYIMTAAVYLVVVLAALTARPWAALGIVTLFGLLRGLAVLVSVRITSTSALHAFHRRFDALSPASRQLAIAVQMGAALVAGLVAGPVVGVVATVAVVALLVLDLRPGLATPRGRTRREVRGGEVRGGEVLGGEVRCGEVRGGEVLGGEVRCGEVRGGEVRGGEVLDGEVLDGEVAPVIGTARSGPA